MKIGLKLNTQFPPDREPVACIRELLEQVRAARDAGFDSVWVSQHYLAAPYQAFQTWPLLARIAPEAGDMMIGTSVFLLTLHNPVYAAEQAATVDAISAGRFVFGVGVGYREAEFEAFGVELGVRLSRFTEALDVAQRLWTEETVTHRGRHFSLTDATLHLKPVQRPHPPIWIGASSDPAVRRVGRFGFPWLINPHVSLSGMTQQMTLLRAAAAEAGKKIPNTVPVFKEFAVAGSRGEALRMAQPYLEPKHQSYAQWGLDKPMPETEQLSVPFDQLAQDRFIIGDPAECAAELRRYHDAVGANHFLLRLQWPGMPQRYALEQIRLVGTDVMPLMRRD